METKGTDIKIIEKVLLEGDLAKLSPQERISHYAQTCQSLGLNPLTKPFDYLEIKGKLMLYAKKDCTDQLRSTRNVNIVRLEREAIQGLFVVTATAITPSGRQDSSIGAVSIEGLKGEALANAMMKAETKAKRRVTLSICGLGILDESEADSIPHVSYPSTDFSALTTGEASEQYRVYPSKKETVFIRNLMKSHVFTQEEIDKVEAWMHKGVSKKESIQLFIDSLKHKIQEREAEEDPADEELDEMSRFVQEFGNAEDRAAAQTARDTGDLESLALIFAAVNQQKSLDESA